MLATTHVRTRKHTHHGAEQNAVIGRRAGRVTASFPTALDSTHRGRFVSDAAAMSLENLAIYSPMSGGFIMSFSIALALRVGHLLVLRGK